MQEQIFESQSYNYQKKFSHVLEIGSNLRLQILIILFYSHSTAAPVTLKLVVFINVKYGSESNLSGRKRIHFTKLKHVMFYGVRS